MCAIVFSTQFVSAQSEQFTKDAIAYVETTGIKNQMNPIKEQFLSAIIPNNVESYNKDFDGVVDTFVNNFSKLITQNFKESDVTHALKLYNETKEFVGLPTLENETEFNTKLQELQTQMMTELQAVIIKYADPEKLN